MRIDLEITYINENRLAIIRYSTSMATLFSHQNRVHSHKSVFELGELISLSPETASVLSFHTPPCALHGISHMKHISAVN